MAGKITDIGERLMLQAAMANIGDLTMHLAKAYFRPTDYMIPDDFSEADYTGYAHLPLDFAGLEAGNPGGKAVADFAVAEFVCTGELVKNQIYGYWVEDAAHHVIAVELFTGNPRPMQFSGQKVAIDFTLRFWSPT